MECPICFELYDEKLRIARNLNCGHTYCEACLEITIHKRECNFCRQPFDHRLKPQQLSKNYIAMNLAEQQRGMMQKLQFCNSHSEALQFYCLDCEQNICSSCVEDHQGHKLIKQAHSIQLLTQKIENGRQRIEERLKHYQTGGQIEKQIKEIREQAKIQEEYLEAEFDNLIGQLQKRKSELKEQLQIIRDKKVESLEIQMVTEKSIAESIQHLSQSFDEILHRAKQQKYLKDNNLIKDYEKLEELVEKDLRQFSCPKNPSNEVEKSVTQIPHVQLGFKLAKTIPSFGFFPKEQAPKILFMGDKNSVLCFDIQAEEWDLYLLGENQLEFQFYSNGVGLRDGSVLQIGGGSSNEVFALGILGQQIHQDNLEFDSVVRQGMLSSRKEHSSVLVGNFVYALGGYESKQKKMLSLCERYNLVEDKWETIAEMKQAKCAFAAAQDGAGNIFVFGGFDGKQRLSTVERYNIASNTWTMLNVQLSHELSNAAAIQIAPGQIVVVGGGSNNGFSLDVAHFDCRELKFTELPKMSCGRDLRNKVVFYGGFLYAIGGNTCTGEKLDVLGKKWTDIPSYKHLTLNNLDSWSCALALEPKVPQKVQKINYVESYQNYQYNSGLSASFHPNNNQLRSQSILFPLNHPNNQLNRNAINMENIDEDHERNLFEDHASQYREDAELDSELREESNYLRIFPP